MSQGNIKFNRVSLVKDQLILTAIYDYCGSDSDDLEEAFYTLNPLVSEQHIPADGVYLMPVTVEQKSDTDLLLLWQ